jgi:hypothetical protein
VYLGGVRQYRRNRILSLQYMLTKMNMAAMYRKGIASEYIMTIKTVAMICEYRSAIRISGPVYRASYFD